MTSDSLSKSGLAMRSGMFAKSVSCGYDYTVIIDINNKIWSFGDNTYGQLGLDDNINKHTPTMINGIYAKYVSCGTIHTVLIACI